MHPVEREDCYYDLVHATETTAEYENRKYVASSTLPKYRVNKYSMGVLLQFINSHRVNLKNRCLLRGGFLML